MTKKMALGKGLGALISDAEEYSRKGNSSMFDEVELTKIVANPFQPRTIFEAEALQELSDSIKKLGVIQPVTLRKIDENQYQLIAGERRFRASALAGLDKIPAYIRKAEDDTMLEMALVENIQREDLDAIEVAVSYNRLIEEFKLTQEELSVKVGKKRATISNYVRLLKLPAEIQLGIRDKKIQMGHARALLGVDDAATQLMIYEQIKAYDFSVRKVEEVVRELSETHQPAVVNEKKTGIKLPLEYKELKKHITKFFGTKVNLTRNESGKGKITIAFTSDDELERIIEILDKLR